MRQRLAPCGARALLPVLLLVLVHAASTVGCAQATGAERFGNITFRTPDGWRRAESGGALLLVPPGLADGQTCVLIILPGEELRGDFRAAFDAARDALQRGERVVARGDVSAERNPNGFDTLSALALTEDAEGKQTYRFYLAAHPGSRFEMFVFAATSEGALRQYVPAFKEFVGGVEFANLREPADAPAPPTAPRRGGREAPAATAGGGLSGLYVATESRQQFNVNTKFYDYVVRQVYYLFSPDGRVYRGLPKGGALDDFDFGRAEAEDPANCGAYRVAGATIQFNWPGAQPTPALDFARAEGGLRIGRTTFLRVESADGLRLEGLFARGSFTNLSGGAGVASGGVGGESRILFNRTGQFAQSGFVGFAGGNAGVGAGVSEGSQAPGTYRVGGNTLELRYADGRTTRHTFFQYPREPDVLVIDGVTYLRRAQ